MGLAAFVAGPVEAITAPTTTPTVATTGSATATAAPSPGTFASLPPTRLLDTRLGHPGPATPAHPVLTIPVLGRGGVPTSGVALVALTLTVVTPTAAGYVGHGQESSVNFAAGQTVANLAMLPVAADGTVSVVVRSGGTTQLLADLAGYTRAGTPLTSGALVTGGSLPGRLFDSRTADNGYVRPGGTMLVDVQRFMPRSTVALLANLTVIAPAASGYVTAYPELMPGGKPPSTSTINFTAGRTTANYLSFPILGGTLVIVNHSSAPLGIVLDGDAAVVEGTPNADGAIQALYPTRVLDTRTGLGAPGPVRGGGTARFTVTGRADVPPSGVSAVMLNVTVTQPSTDGYVIAHPGGSPSPRTSVLNFVRGQTVADAVLVPVGADGTVSLTVQVGGTAQLVADVEGYVTAAAPAPAVTVVADGVIDPQAGGLEALSCAGRTFCVAAGASPGLRTFDGTTWSSPVLPAGLAQPLAVSCASATSCAVVQGDARAFSWDGRSWASSTVSPPSGDTRAVQLASVSCPSVTLCVAVDRLGRAATWDGRQWGPAVTVLQGRTLRSVSCSSPTFCVALEDAAAGTAATFDGSTWAATSALPVLGADPAPGSISCVSSTFCLAAVLDAGNRPESLVYDGRSWQPPVLAGPADSALPWMTVSCVSSTACSLVTSATDSVQTYDGQAWSTPVTLLPGSSVGSSTDAVSCADPQWCVVGDRSGLVFVGAASAWSAPTAVAPLSGRLVTAACGGATFCLADDFYGNVLTYDGTSWGSPRRLLPGHALGAVTCPTPTSCLVGTDDGRLVTVTPSGPGTSVSVDPGHLVTALSCWAADGCAAGDDAGRVVTGSTSGWATPVQVVGQVDGQDRPVDRLSCGSASLCAVLGASRVYSGHGAAWSDRYDIGAYPSDDVACSAVSCIAEGGVGALYRFGPTPAPPSWTWVALHQNESRFGCTLSGRCLLLTSSDLVWEVAGGRIGGAWGPPTPITASALDVSCVDPGVCVGTAYDRAAVFRLG